MADFDFSTFPELETERLILRRIKPDDVAAWLAVWNHEDVMRYMIDFDQPTVDEAEVKRIIGWADKIFTNRTGMRWAITLKPDPTMIGSVGFHLYKKGDRKAEVGYELHRDFWRRGIMSEALSCIVQFGFDKMSLHRIEAEVTVGNEASAGLLRHLGFALEGTLRESVFNQGRYFDMWLFSLLENDWAADPDKVD